MTVLKYSDMLAKYTDIVKGYLDQGYSFCASTYSNGSIHQDLFKGTHIVQVAIEKEYRGLSSKGGDYDIFEIVTYNREFRGYEMEKLEPSFVNKEVNHRTVVATFYSLSCYYNNKVYTIDKDFADACYLKRKERSHSTYPTGKKNLNQDTMKRIVFPWVKRQQGFKSVHLEDISSVHNSSDENGVEYIIYAKGKRLVLMPNRG